MLPFVYFEWVAQANCHTVGKLAVTGLADWPQKYYKQKMLRLRRLWHLAPITIATGITTYIIEGTGTLVVKLPNLNCTNITK